SMNEYGFPMHGPGWIKAGLHRFGELVDPDAGYPPSETETEAVRAFFRRVIPSAAEAKAELVDRCMYDVTPDEDFILDAHRAPRRQADHHRGRILRARLQVRPTHWRALGRSGAGQGAEHPARPLSPGQVRALGLTMGARGRM